MFDVIIVGAGPAGISASLYTKRAGLSTLILHNNDSTLKRVHKIQNYYGFEHGISGNELYENGRKQAENIGVEIREEEVVSLEYDNHFEVMTSKNRYQSKTLILATGNKRKKVMIDGIEKFEGKGVSYCAVCDAFFYQDKNVSVIGNGNYAINELNHLLKVANKVTLLTNGTKAPSFRSGNIDVVDKKIRSVVGEGKVKGIQFEDESMIPTDGIFIAQGVASTFDLARKLGIMTDKQRILVNTNMETNVPGVYACGDNTGQMYQISQAVFEGAKAGMQVIDYLKE